MNAKVPIHNPYLKSSRIKKKTLEILMEAGKTKKKKKNPSQRKDTPKVAQAKASKKKLDEDKAEKNKKSDRGDRGSWQKHTQFVLLTLSGALKNSVGHNPTGKHEKFGKWPPFACSPVIEPSKDPRNFQNLFGDLKAFGKECTQYPLHELDDLLQEDFCLPDLVMWAPELRWPEMYPTGTPNCPFCKGPSCVTHKGWENYFRRCYGPRCNVALQGKRYTCENTSKSFYSYDPDVMSQAPSYVQAFWRENGFHLTHKAGGEYYGVAFWKVCFVLLILAKCLNVFPCFCLQ
jgi:hypothetical protein